MTTHMRTSTQRIYTITTNEQGIIPIGEIHIVLEAAKRAYHRDARQLADSDTWLQARPVPGGIEFLYEYTNPPEDGQAVDPDQLTLFEPVVSPVFGAKQT